MSEVPPAVLAALTTCVHASDVIVALYDAHDVLQFANPAYARRFLRGLAVPVPFADVLRHGFRHGFGVHVGSGDIDSFLAGIAPRRRREPFRAFEVDTVDGEWIWMTETLVEDGWLLSIGTLITPLKQHARLLRRDRDYARLAADTDALTGVFNRRKILEIADAMIGASRRAAVPCCIVLIDLDHFKAVNDTHGHAAGDELLVQFASHCSSGVRLQDRFGRYGGEEFIIVLPDAGRDAAARVVERLRELLRPATLSGVVLPHAYTFSAGIAEAAAEEPLQMLLRRADVALYRAKANGRGRTELA